MIGRLLLLLGGGLAGWVLVSLPARALLDTSQAERVVVYFGVCLLLCLVPAAVTLCWARRALAQSPESQLTAVMGGTGVRMFVTLLAGWLLTEQVPFFRDASFWNWLLAAYLLTLALEITLLLAGRPAAAPNP